MNLSGLWLAGEQRGDRWLAGFLLLVALGLALIGGASDAASAAGAADRRAGLGGFAALFLAFRYAFAGGRAWMLAVDAARLLVPHLPGRVLGVEALRAGVFAMLPALPFALFDDVGAAASALAAAISGIVVGVLFSLVPYRLVTGLVAAVLVLLVGNVTGLLAWTPVGALLAASVAAMGGVTFVRHRVRELAADASDAQPGGAYAMAQAISRHSGSMWTAPNSAPLAVLSEARAVAARHPAPSRLLLVVGMAAGGAGAWWRWALTLAVFPLLMTVFFLAPPVLQGEPWSALLSRGSVFWGLLVVLWVPVAAVLFLWLGTFRIAAQQLRPGSASRDALLLLPGMPAHPAQWRALFRPLIWPPLVMAGLLLATLLPMPSPWPWLAGFAALITAALLLAQPRVVTSPDPGARQRYLVLMGVAAALLAIGVLGALMWLLTQAQLATA